MSVAMTSFHDDIRVRVGLEPGAPAIIGRMLLNKGIAAVPGSAYGDSTSRFVRMSIGTESEERIRQSLLIMKDTIASTAFDAGAVQKKLASLGLPAFSTGNGGER